MFFQNTLPNAVLYTVGEFGDSDFEMRLKFPPYGPKKDVFGVVIMGKDQMPLIGGKCTFDETTSDGHRYYFFKLNLAITSEQFKEAIRLTGGIKCLDAGDQ